jgi:hypothetical protein
METLRNQETEFVLATLKEPQLATLNVLLPFYSLWCSFQCITDCVEQQPISNNRKMEELIAGMCVTKLTLLGASKVTVSKVMSA